MAAIDVIKTNIFSAPMPDMPPRLREIWQAAFMLRRKYSNPSNVVADDFFKAAWSDAMFIAETYGGGETVQALMLEVYLDIERQFIAVQARENADRAG